MSTGVLSLQQRKQGSGFRHRLCELCHHLSSLYLSLLCHVAKPLSGIHLMGDVQERCGITARRKNSDKVVKQCALMSKYKVVLNVPQTLNLKLTPLGH